MRFNRVNLPSNCCIIISPEICPELALYADSDNTPYAPPYACQKHKIHLRAPFGPQEWRDTVLVSYNGSEPAIEDRGLRTCWFGVPIVECPELPTWDFLHDGPDRWKICEKHAQEFKAMRISFDAPEAQGGYDAKRICVCNSKILWSLGCQCGAPQ